MEKPDFFYWHVHHERRLLEWCHGYNERAEYIRTYKPSHEQELRLRLFQPIKGQLPQEVVGAGKAYDDARKASVETGKAYDDARIAHNEAWRAYDEEKKAYNEAWRAYVEAWQAYVEAKKAYDDAREAYDDALSNHKDEIEALHAQECLDCPWDGKTIFSAA